MTKATPSKAAIAELAPTGILRTGINLSNFLLVTGATAAGDPVGVAPDWPWKLPTVLACR
jgi:polar amino acid transport system substrate-binding protein